jgi:hypothetical protein
MSQKTQALAQTAKEMALLVIAGYATAYLLTMIPVTAIPYIGITFCIGMLAYLLYNINLGRIQYRKHLEDLDNSLKNIKK